MKNTTLIFSFIFLLQFSFLHALAQQIKPAQQKSSPRTLPITYSAADIKDGIDDARGLIIGGVVTTCASVGFGAVAYGISNLVYNAKLDKYNNSFVGCGLAYGCSNVPKYPVNHKIAATCGVGIPIACVGIVLTAVGASQIVKWKSRKKEIKAQTGLLDDGKIGFALLF